MSMQTSLQSTTLPRDLTLSYRARDDPERIFYRELVLHFDAAYKIYYCSLSFTFY